MWSSVKISSWSWLSNIYLISDYTKSFFKESLTFKRQSASQRSKLLVELIPSLATSSMNVDTANHNFISAQSNNSSNHKDDESSFANPNTHLSLESSHADQPNFVSTLYSTGQNKVPKFLQRLSLYSPDHLDTPETGGSPKTLQLEDNNLSPKGSNGITNSIIIHN